MNVRATNRNNLLMLLEKNLKQIKRIFEEWFNYL
jgi:hypothetical protein